MFDEVNGIMYLIILNKEYTYYEIIPDLEKKFQRRFSLRHGETLSNILVVIDAYDTRDRFAKSSMYLELKKSVDKIYDDDNEDVQKWMNECDEIIQKYGRVKGMQHIMEKSYQRNNIPQDKLPIELTDEERNLVTQVHEFLNDKVKKGYWIHVCETR